MNTKTLPKPLRGIIPPMVTPLEDVDRLDVEGLERLVEHILAGGVHGLFILGSTGEAPSLSYRLRYELIERVCKLVGGRVPILVGISDTSFVETVKIARKASEHGASGLVSTPPYYFSEGQAELLEYLRHLVPQLPLPLFLYNIPSHTKVSFEPETIHRAAEIKGIAGIKESSGDMILFHRIVELMRDNEEFSLVIGPEQLLAEAILSGAHAGVNGGANLIPELYVELYNSAVSEDIGRARELHEKVMRISNSIYEVGQYPSSYVKGLKCALSCFGICSDFMAEPFHRFREEERALIQNHLVELGLGDRLVEAR